MKTFSSSSLIRVTIGVALGAILTLFINPLVNIFFGKPLNTPWYFAILFVLSGATIVLTLLQVLGQVAEARKDADKIQTHFDSLDSIEEYYSDLAHRIKSQNQDSPLKVTMDVNGTPVTIESNDAGKVEDFVGYLTRSIQADNLANAKAQLLLREDTEFYKTNDTSE
jgi:predicted PurR-regulated permease PerM